MKNLFITLLSVILFTSCNLGNVSTVSGLPDQSYIQIVSTSKYHAPVKVNVDKSTFFSKVDKIKKNKTNYTSYAINTGKRKITVYDENGNKILERTIFISAQETKKILLP